MRHFLIRAFEAIILVCSLIGALGVTLFAAAMVMENITLATLNGSLPGVFSGAPATTEPDALAVWLSAGAVLLVGYMGIILLSGAALTLTGIYRRMTRLVQLIEATPTE